MFTFVDFAGGVTFYQKVNVTGLYGSMAHRRKSLAVLELSRCITGDGWSEDIIIPPPPSLLYHPLPLVYISSFLRPFCFLPFDISVSDL